MTEITILSIILLAAFMVFLGVVWMQPKRNKSRMQFVVLVAAFDLVVIFLVPSAWWLTDLAVVATSVLLGLAIASFLKSRLALVAFLITASVIDVISFMTGPTAVLLRGASEGTSSILSYLCVSAPIKGSTTPLVGIGDLVILAAIFIFLSRQQLSKSQTFLAPVIGLMTAVIVGLIIGGAPPSPSSQFPQSRSCIFPGILHDHIKTVGVHERCP